MGFLSTLGTLGGIIGAPFTGGASLAIGPALGSLGDVLGGQQGGKNNAKVAQGNLNQEQDRNALANYIAQQNAQNTAANTDLQRKQFESTNRSASAKQALIGALLGGGITPTSISGGKASGGLLNSFNGNTDARAAMSLLGEQGHQAQSTPLQFQGGQMITPPKLSTPQNLDTGNGFLSILAQIAQLGGAVSPYIQPGQKPPQVDPQQMAGMQNPNIYGNVRF